MISRWSTPFQRNGDPESCYAAAMTISRKTAALVATCSLAALAAVTPTADARHEDYKGIAVLCYVKTGDTIGCFHAGPMSGMSAFR